MCQSCVAFCTRLREAQEQQAHRLHWSSFRRQHQAAARQFHVLRRARQAPPVSDQLPTPILLPGLASLSDEHWEQLRPFLPPQKPQTGRPAIDHRLIVEGMLWVARTNSRLSRTTRALWALDDGGQPLSALVQRGHLDAHLAVLAPVRDFVLVLGLILLYGTVVLTTPHHKI